MTNIKQEQIRILRCKQVEARTGLSRSTIYLRVQDGTFPRPINLGVRAVGWLESEIVGWINERIAMRQSNDHSPNHCTNSSKKRDIKNIATVSSVLDDC